MNQVICQYKRQLRLQELIDLPELNTRYIQFQEQQKNCSESKRQYRRVRNMDLNNKSVSEIILKQMQHTGAPKYQSHISPEDRQSNISIPKSLGRPSFEIADVNLQNKASLVYAMSIESDNRKSDIFERLLQSEKKSSLRPSSIISSHHQQKCFQFQQIYQHRNSDKGNLNQIEIDHDCKCFENCYQKQCPCFAAKNEICLRGTCCTKCVQLKNIILQNNPFSVPNNGFSLYTGYINNNSQMQNYSQYQYSMGNEERADIFMCNCKNTECLKSYCKCFQNGQFCSQKCGCESCKNKQHSEERYAALQAIKTFELTYCTCKKTKCNKKYCSCYASGVKCGKQCSCENCANCDKNNDMDIEVYDGEQEEDFRNAQMPQRMSFEPVAFQ